MNPTAIQERPSGRSPRQPSYPASIPYVAPFIIVFALLLSEDYLRSVLGELEYPFQG